MASKGTIEAGKEKGIVAITGVTGFIGSAVARQLTVAGWQVRGLVRSPSQVTTDIPNLDKLEVVEGSLENFSSLRQLVRGTRFVVHCAGAVRGAHAEHFNRVNVDGIISLVRIIREINEKPGLLLLSSLAAREPQLSAYAASKKEGERQLAIIADGIPWIALRPPAVYGPGDREMLPLFRLMEKGFALVVGKPRARFSMLYVDDLAAAIQSFLEQSHWSRKIYELHDGHPGGYSWGEVIDLFSRLRARQLVEISLPLPLLLLLANMNQALARLTGKHPMFTPGKIRELTHPDWVCDNQSITAQTGWQPKISLGEGLQRTMNWQ